MKEYIYFLVDRNSSIDTGYCVEIIKVKSEDENKFYELFEEVNGIFEQNDINTAIFTIVAKTQDLIQIDKDDFYITPIQEFIDDTIYDLPNIENLEINKEKLYQFKFKEV